MTGAELLAEVERVRERLRAYERYFDASDILLTPKATEDELAAVEARLGMALPPLLRDFYANVASSLYFGFDVRDEEWEGDGYPDGGGGAMTIVAVHELKSGRVPGLVPFTSDGWGNGWCLDLRTKSGRVVWHDHDDPDGDDDKERSSVDEVFAELVDEVLYRAQLPEVAKLLHTGCLPAPGD